MPLAAGFSTLKAQLDAAANSGLAGNPALLATQITTAISSVLPMGLFVGAGIPFPPPPAAFAATQAQLNSAFNSGIAGNPQLMAVQIASAISVLSPIVPPSGLAVLIQQLQSIFNLGIAGDVSIANVLLATAIISYYTMGLVI